MVFFSPHRLSGASLTFVLQNYTQPCYCTPRKTWLNLLPSGSHTYKHTSRPEVRCYYPSYLLESQSLFVTAVKGNLFSLVKPLMRHQPFSGYNAIWRVEKTIVLQTSKPNATSNIQVHDQQIQAFSLVSSTMNTMNECLLPQARWNFSTMTCWPTFACLITYTLTWAALVINRQTLRKRTLQISFNGAKWRKANICSNLPAIQTPRWGLAAQVAKPPP